MEIDLTRKLGDHMTADPCGIDDGRVRFRITHRSDEIAHVEWFGSSGTYKFRHMSYMPSAMCADCLRHLAAFCDELTEEDRTDRESEDWDFVAQSPRPSRFGRIKVRLRKVVKKLKGEKP